jgi:hypothetical protein
MKLKLILLLTVLSLNGTKELHKETSQINVFINRELEQDVRSFKGKEYPRKLDRRDFISYLIYNGTIQRSEIGTVKFKATFRGHSFNVLDHSDNNE